MRQDSNKIVFWFSPEKRWFWAEKPTFSYKKDCFWREKTNFFLGKHGFGKENQRFPRENKKNLLGNCAAKVHKDFFLFFCPKPSFS